MNSRREILVVIVSGAFSVVSGCSSKFNREGSTNNEVLLTNKSNVTREITLSVFSEGGDTLIEVTEELPPRTASEGHYFEGMAEHAIASGGGQKDEESIELGESYSACNPDGKIRIDAAFDADGELNTGYVC